MATDFERTVILKVRFHSDDEYAHWLGQVVADRRINSYYFTGSTKAMQTLIGRISGRGCSGWTRETTGEFASRKRRKSA